MKLINHVALALAAICSAIEAIDGQSSVADLSREDFDKFISSHDIVMTEFYAPWCGVCNDVAPVYEQAAAESPTENVTYARVDCVENEDLCEEYLIGMFPTFYVFKRNSKKWKVFNEKREVGEFHSFMERQARPATRTLSSKDHIDSFKTEGNVAIVAFADSKNEKKMLEEYSEVADEMRDDFLFGIVSDLNVAEAAGVMQPSIVLYKAYDEGIAIYNGVFGKQSIKEFVRNASIPLIDDYLKAHERISEGLPVCLLYYDNSEDRERVVKMLRPVAEEHKGRFIVVTVDANVLPKLAEHFDVKKETWPGLAITDKSGHKYPLRHPNLTTQRAAQHVRDYLKGRLQPHFRSQVLSNDMRAEGAVQHVVRNNFKDVILDNNKDVLLEFYAPWCGFCKKLEPEYEELARLYSKFSDRVTIAKIDATANDIDGHEISGFPTIKLFPAHGKNVIDFNGNQTIKDLAEFIKMNGTYGVGVALPLSSQVEDEPKSIAATMTENVGRPRNEL